ncbi:MAG: helix-hairpin-helix domain-containing protein [Fusobacteriaceae bacterium]
MLNITKLFISKFFLVLTFLMIFFITFVAVFSKGKFVYGDNTKNSQDMRLDINIASEEELLRNGINPSQANKILEYKKITGGFENINELKNISGIGAATFLKLEKKLAIKSKPNKKNLQINSADDVTLKYYGFSKNEIKNIRKFKSQNSKFKNNLDLMKVFDKKKYDEIKDKINY